jgi:ppGpp synthetase/RelA/SpoT-type nucleotidyltranferase
MWIPLTKAQVNRLGDKLRKPGPPDEDTLGQLQAFRDEYDSPMVIAQGLILTQLGVSATARLKTTNTIVEKLRREKTRLAEMQDIAGLRIVNSMELHEQDALAQRVQAVFPGSKLIDRRARPSHGYRAIHVIARVDGRPVEVQVRTDIQDLWAQAMEALADRVGRSIRYGGVPETSAEEVAELRAASVQAAAVENEYQRLRTIESEIAPPNRSLLGTHELALRELQISRLRATLPLQAEAIRGALRSILGGRR